MDRDNLQLSKLQDTLIEAFPTHADLERMVWYGMNENLSAIVKEDNLQQAVFELIRWSRAQGKLEMLISAARNQNSQNPKLISIAKEFGLSNGQHPTLDVPIDEAPHHTSDASSVAPIPSNVFCFNQQLLSPKEFYGRARERMVVLDRTRKQASTSIVGPRRIGKTWLLNYLQLTARQELGSRFLVKYQDVTIPRCATVAGFTSCIIEELTAHKRTFEQGNEGLVALEQVIQDFNRRHQVLVLCIDEFEGFGNHQEFDLNFFTALRALTQCGLCLVVASKEPLITIVGELGKTSGFFNVFRQCTLNPFMAKEAEAFVQSKGDQAHLTDYERQMLLDHGQLNGEYWPIRLQLVGEMLLDDKILAMQENEPDHYRPTDPAYWQNFVYRLEECYRGVVR